MAHVVRKIRWGIGIAGLALVLAGCAALHRFEYSQVYHPSKDAVQWKEPAADRRDFYFQTSDGFRLNGWFFPASAGSPRKQEAILVCHGNGGNITYLERLCARLTRTGANVLLFDYRGYGNSDGRPSEEGTYLDGQAAYGWLRGEGFAASNIFVYGESLGGGIASELVRREPAGGLILESTFTSTPDVGAALFPWLPVRTISKIRYDTRKRLPEIHVPVLILHSHSDGLIPFRLAKKNFEAANEPKLLVEITGGHAAAPEGCYMAMDKYLAAIEAARAGGREVKF